MQKPSENGTELNRSNPDIQNTETQNKESVALRRDFFVDGQLDVDAYFEFIEDYQTMFPDKNPRTPIQIKIAKL